MTKQRFTPAPGIPEQIADYLQRQIVRGELAPGERIAEARVTAALAVSRGSVREALRLLHARHLVAFAPRRGARVSGFGPADVSGLYDVQMALLTLLVQRAAERWTDAQTAPFFEFQRRIGAAARAGDAIALIELSRDFQRAICALVANPFLSETLERLNPAFSRAHFRALAVGPGERLGLAQFIDDALAAVLRRDRDEVAGIVARYGCHQRDVVLATFGEAPSPSLAMD